MLLDFEQNTKKIIYFIYFIKYSKFTYNADRTKIPKKSKKNI